MKATILYYTNNLLAPKLLENTLTMAIIHAKQNDCELIISSHFPITDKYEVENIPEAETGYKTIYNPETKQQETHPIYKYLVKNLNIPIDPSFCKSYVVGKLVYSYVSIMRQLLFSLDKSTTDNIILMEHDCFYPTLYFPTVIEILDSFRYDMAFVSHCVTFLNQDGYFDIGQTQTLSTCSFKKKVARKVFEKKLELLLKNTSPLKLEPSLKYVPQDLILYPQDYFVEKVSNIDFFLKYNRVLDVKHYLNQNGLITNAKRSTRTGAQNKREHYISDNKPNLIIKGIDKDSPPGYYHNHPYWGPDTMYINMFKDYVMEEEKTKYVYGVEPY